MGILNGVFIQNYLSSVGMKSILMSSMMVERNICSEYNRLLATYMMDKGNIIVLAGGLGNPYFTTDTASVIRALEMKCNLLLKATKVCGVYSKDPVLMSCANYFFSVSYK